jgi:hypothetical protein
MWFVPREVVFRAGSQRTASCRLENLTLPCPVDADWWLRHEYGDDYLTPDHQSVGFYDQYYRRNNDHRDYRRYYVDAYYARHGYDDGDYHQLNEDGDNDDEGGAGDGGGGSQGPEARKHGRRRRRTHGGNEVDGEDSDDSYPSGDDDDAGSWGAGSWDADLSARFVR